jgi:hypothetical protein
VSAVEDGAGAGSAAGTGSAAGAGAVSGVVLAVFSPLPPHPTINVELSSAAVIQWVLMYASSGRGEFKDQAVPKAGSR